MTLQTTLQVELDVSVLRTIRVIVQARNFETAHTDPPGGDLAACDLSPALEPIRFRRRVVDIDPHNTRDGHGSRDQLAQVYRLSKGKIVRVKEPASSVGQVGVAQNLQ